MAQGELKGNAFLWTMKFIEAHFGAEAVRRVLDALSPEDRAVIGEIILPISWYPLPVFGRLLRAMDETLGKGDLGLAYDRGIWVAQQDVKTIHKLVLKVFSPEWVIQRATGTLWRKFHSSGSWVVDDLGGGRARAQLVDLGHVDAAVCESIAGWIVGLFRLAGAKDVIVRHSACRARGSATCVYEADRVSALTEGPESAKQPL